MPNCPVCARPLETVRQREGVFHFCAECRGRALSFPQLRRVAGDAFAVKLLRLVKVAKRRSDRRCPFCSQPMLLLAPQAPTMELMACSGCSIVWFEAAQYELVPEGAAESTGTLSMLATEILAAARLKELKEREKAEQEEEQKKRKLRESFKTIWRHGKSE